MPYDINKLATMENLQAVSQRAKAAITAAIAALPVEMFLDNAKTAFVPNFTFSAATYPGATNPNLDGKPVMVLAVKGVDNSAPSDTSKQTTTYSFLNMSTLVDTYTAKSGNSAKILNIAGYEIEFKIDPSNDNAIEVTANGIKVNISGKIDKVANATVGNIPSLTANGGLADSGVAVANILTTADVATDAEATEMLNEIFGTSGS